MLKTIRNRRVVKKPLETAAWTVCLLRCRLITAARLHGCTAVVMVANVLRGNRHFGALTYYLFRLLST